MKEPGYTTGVMSSWQLDMTDYGCVLTVYVAENSHEVKKGDGREVMIALTDQQLQIVMRDVERAIESFERELHGQPKFWKRLLRRCRLS